MAFNISPNMEKSVPPLIRSSSNNHNEDSENNQQSKEGSGITVKISNSSMSNSNSASENSSNLIPLKKNNSHQNLQSSKNESQTSGTSFIPRLNLASTSRHTQSMNISRTNSSFNSSGKAAIPGLNLQTLNLSNLPPNSSKNECHQVIICLNYNAENGLLNDNDQLSKQISNSLNQKVKLEDLGDITVIESNENDDLDSAIPSIQAIDLAYQNLENYPFLIKQNTSEISNLTNFIDDTFTEISELTKLREKLKIENVLLKERINVAHEEMERFKKCAVQTKKDYDLFVAKFQKK